MNSIYKWPQAIIQKVWQKAKPEGLGNESKGFRKDACGAWMNYSQYGDRNAKYGWEIDHIMPLSLGGSDDIYNLQPLHWRNNVSKGDSVVLKCEVRDN